MFAVALANKQGVATFLVAWQRDHVRIAVDYSRRVNNPGLEVSNDNYKYPWRQLKIPTGFLLDSAL